MTRFLIAFDLRWISRDSGGTTTYALNLLRFLVGQENEFCYRAIALPDGEEQINRILGEQIPKLEIEHVNYSPFHPHSQLELPGKLRKMGVALFHVPSYLGFLGRTGLPVIVTVHDLIAYLHPERQPKAKATRLRPLFKYGWRRSIALADVVVVSSQATGNELRQVMPGVDSKMAVVWAGINPIFFQRCPEEMLRTVRREFGLQDATLLYVGRRDPNKNLIPLIRAVGILGQRGWRVQLLICGPPDSRYPEPEELVRKMGWEKVIRFPGFVDIKTLQALYQIAQVVVYPSSQEGFGLPPVEAMASGVPVVCSSCPALREVVGDAALFVEPTVPESIAAGIERILSDSGLRAELTAKGYERAKRYSWDAAASQIVAIYRRLLR